MAKYIDAKWHYPQKGEYPVIYGEYEHKHYPQIPCLVFYHGMYGVRFWNCTEECWDDEECDDFYCSKEEVERWMYIDSLQQEQPSEDLEKYASRAGFDYVDDIEYKYPGHRWNDHDVEFAYRDGIIAGAEWQKEQMISALKNDGELPIEFIDKFHEIDRNAFQNGQKNVKEQMLKDAVEGEVVELGETYKDLSISVGGKELNEVLQPLGVKDGDKVKVIIVKEAEK